MNTKYTANPRYPFWIILFLIIIIPISISYNDFDDFTFGAFQTTVEDPSSFLFTLPISFFFIIPIIFMGLLNFNKDKLIFIFLVFSLVSFISSIFNNNIPHLIVIIKIVIPILTLLGFEIYFRRKIFFREKEYLPEIIQNSNSKIIYMFMIVFLITMMSPFFLDNNYNWLTNKIAIYDYLQYFPLIFILLLGVLASNKNRLFILLVFYLSFYLFDLTDTVTFFVLLVLFGIYYLLIITIGKGKNNIVLISRTFICIIFFSLILYHFLVIIYLSFITLDFFDEYNVLGRRLELMNIFYSNSNIFEFFTPIRISTDYVDKFYHNELAVLISAIGIFGASLFYLIFFKRLWHISGYYPQVAVAASLFSIFAGIVNTINLHPYTFIISSFIISYYYTISKVQSQSQSQSQS